jgi:hypothetical protein
VRPSAAERPAREKLFQRFHDEWIAEQKDGRMKYDAVKKIIADIRAGR